MRNFKLLIALLASLYANPLGAQLAQTGAGGVANGDGGGCTNSLDFSQACNSQYLGAV